jgi:hypothetical protein
MPQASGARADRICTVNHVLSNGEFSSQRDTKLPGASLAREAPGNHIRA